MLLVFRCTYKYGVYGSLTYQSLSVQLWLKKDVINDSVHLLAANICATTIGDLIDQGSLSNWRMIRTFGLVASRWGAKTLFHRAPAHLRASCLIPSQWERASLKNSPRYLASLSQNLVRPPVQSEDSTIFALSTAPGKSAIAIIRISGPHCKQVLY